MRDEGFEEEVKAFWQSHTKHWSSKIPSSIETFTIWGRNRFGDIPKEIKISSAQLENANKRVGEVGMRDHIKALEAKLDDILLSEEIWWWF